MTPQPDSTFVSRGGEKLAAALDHFGMDVGGLCCADLGSHVGGFVDCLLQRGAAKVFSVDTSYGTLAWKLRKDDRVVVMERTNAMHVELPEPVDLVTIDVGWTPQAKVLPNVARLLRPVVAGNQTGDPPRIPPPANAARELSDRNERAEADGASKPQFGPGQTDGGRVLTLIKPHYEAGKDRLVDGVLPDESLDEVIAGVLSDIAALGWHILGTTESPIRGHGGNREVLALLTRT